MKAWGALVLLACAVPQTVEQSPMYAAVTGELERQLRVLLAPTGDVAYRRVRDEALAYLLAHADQAHPQLLALAAARDPAPLVLLALPRFGLAESVPILERALRAADDPTTVVAAQALAEHPSPSARKVLERALADARDQVVVSAADGLAQRGDKNACAALRLALSRYRDADVCERVREAMDALRCP